MLEHKFSKLLTDQRFSRSDNSKTRKGLLQSLQTKVIKGAAGKQWEDGWLDAVRPYSWDVNISFNLGSHRAASLVAKLKEKV